MEHQPVIKKKRGISPVWRAKDKCNGGRTRRRPLAGGQPCRESYTGPPSRVAAPRRSRRGSGAVPAGPDKNMVEAANRIGNINLQPREPNGSPPVQAAPDWALFLDVDGTLLSIAATPDAVVVSKRLRQALRRLRGVRSIDDVGLLNHAASVQKIAGELSAAAVLVRLFFLEEVVPQARVRRTLGSGALQALYDADAS